jgi:hypothetical protein
MGLHTCNPRIWEAEAGGLQVQGQQDACSLSLSQKKKKVDCQLIGFQEMIGS